MVRITIPRRSANALAAALIATGLSSCQTAERAKQIGSTAAKPFNAVGQAVGNTAKKANPMRLLNRKKDKGEPAVDVGAEIADVATTGQPQPVTAPQPSRNTATPGAQRPPGTATASSSRSSLSLPSRPAYTPPPSLPSRPAPASTATATPPPSTASARPEPAATLPPRTPSVFDEPLRLDTPPLGRGPVSAPISNPPSMIEDDEGFIDLTPKLPGEEDILPPQ